jgi:PHD/YefM family antitoxin component YafN of YafNO toxin-antitoxin module
MVTVHPEYVVDEKQNRKAVLLPAAEWDRIVDELEELDDIRAYDAAQPHIADRLPFEQAVREIQQDYDA